MRMRSTLFLFLPLAALLGGCPVWGSDNGGGGTNPTTCRTNGDCRTGYYCDASTSACVMSPTCSNDAHCAVTQHCDFRDTCVPDVAGSCRTAADCSGSQVCVEGFCRVASDDADNEVCKANYDCGGGRICVNSACVHQCTSNSQCGSGQTCSNNRCVVNGNQCDTSSDCSGSRHCVEGRCLDDCRGSATCSNPRDECGAEDDFCRPDWQPSGFCDGNEDCNQAVGSVCDLTDHVCRVRCGGCAIDADCRPGGVGTATCSGGFCMLDTGSGASSSNYCQSRDVQLTVCAADGYCHTANEGTRNCTVQSECASGQSCVDGHCTTP